MGTLVIWGGDDHQVRAEKLATTYGTTAQNITLKPKKVTGLDTLVFWGHGDAKDFCHKNPGEFVELVAAWKKLNAGLATVEIITCNARHKNSSYGDSYTEQVVKLLTTKQAGIRFKALPVATTKNGTTCEWSILKWNKATATWAYVGAPTNTKGSSSQLDTIMHDGVTLLEDFMPPRGTLAGYRAAIAAMEASKGMKVTDALAVKRKWDQTKVDEYNAKVKFTRENTFIMAGTVGSLRWFLADIR